MVAFEALYLFDANGWKPESKGGFFYEGGFMDTDRGADEECQHDEVH